MFETENGNAYSNKSINVEWKIKVLGGSIIIIMMQLHHLCVCACFLRVTVKSWWMHEWNY